MACRGALYDLEEQVSVLQYSLVVPMCYMETVPSLPKLSVELGFLKII